jgi:hypothetical protein
MKNLTCIFLLTGLALSSLRAQATDGCKVLLCLAGNWSNLSQCRPDVEQAIREVAEGRGWPSCDTAGAGNQATFQATTEATCPPFYSTYNVDTGAWSSCQYSTLITVRVNNELWSDLFSSFPSTATSTRYYAPARAALGESMDPRYDLDAAAYIPPAPPTCAGGGSC